MASWSFSIDIHSPRLRVLAYLPFNYWSYLLISHYLWTVFVGGWVTFDSALSLFMLSIWGLKLVYSLRHFRKIWWKTKKIWKSWRSWQFMNKMGRWCCISRDVSSCWTVGFTCKDIGRSVLLHDRSSHIRSSSEWCCKPRLNDGSQSSSGIWYWKMLNLLSQVAATFII